MSSLGAGFFSHLFRESSRPAARMAVVGLDSWNEFEKSSLEWSTSKKHQIEEYSFAYPRHMAKYSCIVGPLDQLILSGA